MRRPPTFADVVVPLVDGEVVVARDGDDGRGGHGRVRVGRHVRHGRVGQELHDHAHVVRHRREHHRRLQSHEVKSCVLSVTAKSSHLYCQ